MIRVRRRFRLKQRARGPSPEGRDGLCRESLTAVLCVLVIACALLLGASPSAFAGTGLLVSANVPTPLASGQQGVASTLTIANANTGSEAGLSDTLTQITLVPGCGSRTVVGPDCQPTGYDPSALRPRPTGVGQTGTACAGVIFDLGLIDPYQGKYQLTPSATVVLAAAPSATAVCRIALTLDVYMPTRDAAAGVAGIQTEVIAGAVGLSSDDVLGSGFGTREVTIGATALPIATQPSTAAAAVGSPFHDTATLQLPITGTPPTGTVTFDLYGPADATCAGPPVFSSTDPLDATGRTAVSKPFTATAPGIHRFVARYSGDPSYGPSSTVCDDDSEWVVVVAPMIAVSDRAVPATQVAPGGTFTFLVRVSNPSATDPITIDGLVDSVHGDLATRPGSTCATLIGSVLAPKAVSPQCSFTAKFTGTAGDSQTDTLTATGTDTNGFPATSTGTATVSLTAPAPSPTQPPVAPPPPAVPALAVTSSASPAARPEPGGLFTYKVTVSNPSTLLAVTITGLSDDTYGDLATLPGSACGALVGRTLAPGASTSCSFTAAFSGRAGDAQTDSVTVTGRHGTAAAATVTAATTATVTITPAATPQLALATTASPASRVEPGGRFAFTVTVSNPSSLNHVTITGLSDDVYGDLAQRSASTCGSLVGVTLAPGATSAACRFSATFTGAAGASQTDVVTVTGRHAGLTTTSTARTTVSLTAARAAPAAGSGPGIGSPPPAGPSAQPAP